MAGGTIGSKEHVRPAYLNMKLSMVKKIDDQESSRVQPDGPPARFPNKLDAAIARHVLTPTYA